MNNDQSFYYEFKGDELIMYLTDKREGYITRIPSIYNGLCKHIKSAQINTLFTLDDNCDKILAEILSEDIEYMSCSYVYKKI